MSGLVIETTPMLRDLLVAALVRRGIARDVFEYRYPLLSRDIGGTPSDVFIQQGGMVGLDRAGVDVSELAKRGTIITSMVMLDRTGSHRILEYPPALPGAGPFPILVSLDDVRDAIARAAAPAPPVTQAVSLSKELEVGWSSVPCPGILIRVVAGRLRKPGRFVLWTGSLVHIGIVPLPANRLFTYAVSRRIMNKEDEKNLCVTELNQMTERLSSELCDIGSAGDDTWFPLERIGYRACRPSGTNILRWGSTLLRLHPLTGQHLSYWAIQSARLADHLARNGMLSPTFFAQLDQDNARMLKQHQRAMNFHLAPSWTWEMLRQPYALALHFWPLLRRGSVRRFALLDFLSHS